MPIWGPMRTNIFAYTDPDAGLFPSYISVNQDGDKITVTVRSPRTEDGQSGDSASVDLTKDQARDLYRALLHAVVPTDRA